MTSKKPSDTMPPPEQSFSVPLSSIVIDSNWNARSGDFLIGSGLSEVGEHEFLDLVNTISARGQDTPVVVTPRKDGKFQLRAGFRRCAAIGTIAKRDNIAEPTVKVVVRELDDLGAAEINARENIARENLRVPDKAFAVARIQDLQKKAKRYESEASVAQACGISVAFCNKLLFIVEKLHADLFKFWRSSPRPLPVLTVYEIAKLNTKEEQEAAYKAATDGRPDKVKGGPGRAGNLFERTKTKAEKMGRLLGRLERAEYINCKNLDYSDQAEIELPDGKTESYYVVAEVIEAEGAKLTKRQWESVAKVAAKAHEAAKSGEDEEEESDEDAA